MAMADIVPSWDQTGVVFPITPAVDYAKEVASVYKFPDKQCYTIMQIYGMVKTALTSAGVSANKISWQWFLFFFREMLNDYSSHVGELQRAFHYTGGGAVFKIENLRDVLTLYVNNYPAGKVAESILISYRAAESSVLNDAYIYSLNGNMISVYPAIESSDEIVIYTSMMADDINDAAGKWIIPPADGYTLYHGILWKCLEAHQKPFAHEMNNYMTKRVERKSLVENRMYPSQLRPAADIL